MRYNSELKTSCGYYRLVESYRNFEGRICHRTILNVGFLHDLKAEDLNKIQKQLTDKAQGKLDLFVESDKKIRGYVERLWQEMIEKKRIDLPEIALEKRKKLVDLETIRNKDVREIGTEWIGYQTLEQLKLKSFLEKLGWEESQIQLALTQIISRAVYPFSELRTSRWIQENSAICEITGYPPRKNNQGQIVSKCIEAVWNKRPIRTAFIHKNK